MLTYTKTEVTRTNPFDDTQETLFEITNVTITGGKISELFAFSTISTDAEITAAITAKLEEKGYIL